MGESCSGIKVVRPFDKLMAGRPTFEERGKPNAKLTPTFPIEAQSLVSLPYFKVRLYLQGTNNRCADTLEFRPGEL